MPRVRILKNHRHVISARAHRMFTEGDTPLVTQAVAEALLAAGVIDAKDVPKTPEKADEKSGKADPPAKAASKS